MTRKYSLLTGLATLCLIGLSGPTAWSQDAAPSILHPSATAAAPIAGCPCQGGQSAECLHGACNGACGDARDCRLHGHRGCRGGACGGACGGQCGGGRCGCGNHLAGAAHSGQPLIDPWMRADWRASQQAAVRSWHAGYYNTQYGAPVALVVPPTSRMQTRWGWGVSQSTMSPIYHQFERPYPGPFMGGAGSPLLPTPRWPSHTDQFGVYYVRGPW